MQTALRLPTTEPLYTLLREGHIEEFNQRVQAGETIDLTHCDLSRLDLRGLHTQGLDFTNSYFRLTNLSGIDFSEAILRGASFKKANISGVLFPVELSAEEIKLSIEYGTRVRYISH